jgi:hypothetical protein
MRWPFESSNVNAHSHWMLRERLCESLGGWGAGSQAMYRCLLPSHPSYPLHRGGEAVPRPRATSRNHFHTSLPTETHVPLAAVSSCPLFDFCALQLAVQQLIRFTPK